MALFVVDTFGDENVLKDDTDSATRAEYGAKFDSRTASRSLLSTDVFTLNRYGAADENSDNDDEDDDDYFGLPPPKVDISELIDNTLTQTTRNRTKQEEVLEHVSELVDATVESAQKHAKSKRKRIINLDHTNFNPHTGKFDDDRVVRTCVQKELDNSNAALGLESRKEVPTLTKMRERILKRRQRSKTKGEGWYNLPATEKTEEVRNDLKILQMRSVLDPKRFYKKNDLKVLPKYFQIGTVQHSPLDYYNERNTRKNKKKSMVEELLTDENFQNYTKRKFKEVTAHNNKYRHRKAMKKMKKLKKNKK